MNNNELKTIEFMINYLNQYNVKYKIETRGGENNLWFEIVIKFRYNNETQKIIFSIIEENKIYLYTSIDNQSSKSKELSELRFKETVITIVELLKSINRANNILHNIDDFSNDVERKEIYTENGYELI